MGNYSNEEKLELLKTARDSIKNYLEKTKVVIPKTQNPKFLEKRGAFVTLHKKGQLQGCIGHPLPVDLLINSVAGNAVAAAFEDHRFPPLQKEELEIIDIEISVLTVPQKVETYRDIIVGEDGIIIGKGYNKGLLLPQVPVEQGWNLEEYVSYGCIKAGLAQDEWRRGVNIEIFKADVFGELELLKNSK